MDKTTNKEDFLSNLASALRVNPEFSSDALKVCVRGMEMALDKERLRVHTKDTALLAALVLVKEKRISPELSKTLSDAVIRGISIDNMAPVERDFKENNAIRDVKK